MGPPVQMETQVANIEMELNNDLSSGEPMEAQAPQGGGNVATPEPTTTLFLRAGCLLIFLCSSDFMLGEIPPRVTA